MPPLKIRTHGCWVIHWRKKIAFCYLPRRPNLVVWHFSASVVVFPPSQEVPQNPAILTWMNKKVRGKSCPEGISCGEEGVPHALFSCVKASELSKEKPWKKVIKSYIRKSSYLFCILGPPEKPEPKSLFIVLVVGKVPLGHREPSKQNSTSYYSRGFITEIVLALCLLWTTGASVVMLLEHQLKNLVGNFCIKTRSKSSPFYVGISSLTQQHHRWIILLAKHLWLHQSFSLLQYWTASPSSHPQTTFHFLDNLVMSVMLPFKIPCSYMHVTFVTPTVVAHRKQSAK